MTTEQNDNLIIDARGVACPMPVIHLAKQARELNHGAQISVWCTDPAAKLDIPAWARMLGHEVTTPQALSEKAANNVQVPVIKVDEYYDSTSAEKTKADGTAFTVTVRLVRK